MPRTNWIHWKSMQTLHRLYLLREHTANWIPLEINAKYIHIEHSESTGIHWRSMQKIYMQRTHRRSWIPLEINAKYTYTEKLRNNWIQPEANKKSGQRAPGVHYFWKSVRRTAVLITSTTRVTHFRLNPIGDQC